MASTLRRSSLAFSLAIVGIFLRLGLFRSAFVLVIEVWAGAEEKGLGESKKNGPDI